MEGNKVAVLMSLYKNDKIEYIMQSINSILDQSFHNLKLILIVDGPIYDSVRTYLNSLDSERIVLIDNRRSNEGLAYSLNEGIEYILNHLDVQYIARMDADDISLPSRIEEQVSLLDNNDGVDVVGTDIIEFNEISGSEFYKAMDTYHEKMLNRIIKRSPFNHPTVVFRKCVFESGLRYKASLKNTQDYYLWIDLLAAGYKFYNINKPLLRFRIDENFHKRRGVSKALNDVRSRIYAFKNLNNVSLSNILYVFALLFLRLSPEFLKKVIYKYAR